MAAAVTGGQGSGSGAGLAEVIDHELVARLAGRARAQGLSLVGEGGLLQQLTKRVLEAALDGEWTRIWTTADTSVTPVRAVTRVTAAGRRLC